MTAEYSVMYLKMADNTKQLVVRGNNNTIINATEKSTIHMVDQKKEPFASNQGSIGGSNGPTFSGTSISSNI